MIYLLFILLAALAYFVIKIIIKSTDQNRDFRRVQEIENYKKASTKVKVDLNTCIFKSNSWTSQNALSPTYSRTLDQLAGKGERNIQKTNYALNLIELKIKFEEKELLIKELISIETDKLKIWFALKQETYAYIKKYTAQEFFNTLGLTDNKGKKLNFADTQLDYNEFDHIIYDGTYVYEYYLDLSFINNDSI